MAVALMKKRMRNFLMRPGFLDLFPIPNHCALSLGWNGTYLHHVPPSLDVSALFVSQHWVNRHPDFIIFVVKYQQCDKMQVYHTTQCWKLGIRRFLLGSVANILPTY